MRELPNGYKLEFDNSNGYYLINGVIGKGASTVAYSADYNDIQGNLLKCIVKEFNPEFISLNRDSTGCICVDEKDSERFNKAAERFRTGFNKNREIRNQLLTMNQVPVTLNRASVNNTEYVIVAANNGATYDERVNGLTLLERMTACLSVAKMTGKCHELGYICLDLKPQNIFLIEETLELVYFIDFDSVCKKGSDDFGTVSFTKNWAAPEQINVYRNSEITEKADIFTLGELIFWSVFGRHSKIEERRGFSKYPFDDVNGLFNNELKNPKLRELFSSIFKKTIRTAISARFSNTDDVIEILDRIIDELRKKEYICNSVIHTKDFFIGRDNELLKMHECIKNNSVVFICGIGGIGKSEIAKNYYNAHKQEYANTLYFTYNGNLESMICDDSIVSIANFSRVPQESESHYCERKLMKLKELVNNALIVIDNLNVSTSEIDDPALWKELLSLNGKFIITTRYNETEYPAVHVEEFKDIETLKSIFKNNCEFNEEQDSFVEQIIEVLDRHTLAVELVSKSAKAEHVAPEQMLEKLKESGISSIDTDNVPFLKDGNAEDKTAFFHLKKLFSMAGLSNNKIFLLSAMAFMPIMGVNVNDFCYLFELDDHNDLNWLINHGWINCLNECDLILHPILANIVVERLKKSEKNSDWFFQKLIHIVDTPNTVKQTTLLRYVAKLTKGHGFVNDYALHFINVYVAFFCFYNSHTLNVELLNYTIEIAKNTEETFNPVLHYVYYNNEILFGEKTDIDELIERYQHIIKRLDKKSDFYEIHFLHSLLTALYLRKLAFFPTNKNILTSFRQMTEIGLNEIRNYGIASKKRLDAVKNGKAESRFVPVYNVISLEVFVSPFDSCVEELELPSKLDLRWLKSAVTMRKDLFQVSYYEDISNNNRDRISIDHALKNYCNNNYSGAKSELNEIVKLYNENSAVPTINLYRVHWYLGLMAFNEKQFSVAEDNIKVCIKIAEQLGLEDTYKVQSLLVNIYIETERTSEAKKLNDYLYETIKKSGISNGLYLAEILYCKGVLEYCDHMFGIGSKHIHEARSIFERCKAKYSSKQVGKAKCYRKLVELCLNYKTKIKGIDTHQKYLSKMLEWINIPIKVYKEIYGSRNADYLSCIALKKKIKKMNFEQQV